MTQVAAVCVVRVRAKPRVETGGEGVVGFAFDEQRIMPAPCGTLWREHREAWRRFAASQRSREGACDERFRQLLAAEVRDIAAASEKAQRRSATNEAVHFHEVAELVAPQSAASGHNDAVAFAALKLMSKPHFAASVGEFVKVGSNRHGVQTTKRDGDEGFRREQALRLNDNARQPVLQIACGQRGLRVAPATHHPQVRPDSLWISWPGAAEFSGPTRLRSHDHSATHF